MKALSVLLVILMVLNIFATQGCHRSIGESVDQEKITELENQITALENQITALEKEVAQKQEKITELENQVTGLKNELTEKQAKIEELEARIAELEKPPTPWLTIYLPVPREIQQPNYFQTVKSLSVTANVFPLEITNLTDQSSNTYKALSWQAKQTGEIAVSLKAIIYRERKGIPVTTSDPYPLPENLLPENIRQWLRPTSLIQCGDSAIVALAQELSQGLTKEVEVVTNVFNWMAENVKWGCPAEIENYATDALWTLKHREGNCVNHANLTIALLRAQGIPAREAKGFKGYEHNNPGYLEPAEGSDWHVWVEVYYPEIGWVLYDATYFPHPYYLIYGIHMLVEPTGFGHYSASGGTFTANESYRLVGLGENKVEFTYTFTIVFSSEK